MGQIPRSTERISSLIIILHTAHQSICVYSVLVRATVERRRRFDVPRCHFATGNCWICGHHIRPIDNLLSGISAVLFPLLVPTALQSVQVSLTTLYYIA